MTEGMLAWVAFADYDNPCTKTDLNDSEKLNPPDEYTFPCRVSGLYN